VPASSFAQTSVAISEAALDAPYGIAPIMFMVLSLQGNRISEQRQ
jgi:hypothetical protein